jgi:hypothetical protein
MLADMTPEEFDERWAHWRVDPWGQEMEIGSAVGAMIINTIRQALASERIPEDQMLRADFFLPKTVDDEPLSDFVSGFLQTMRARIGV